MVSKTVFRYSISAFVLFILGLYPIVAAFAQQERYDGWGMGPGMMGGWGMGWFGGIFMILFGGVVLWYSSTGLFQHSLYLPNQITKKDTD